MGNKIKLNVNIDDCAPKSTSVKWCGNNFNVRNYLSINEMLSFVRNVCDMCFNSDDGTYLPELKDFAIKYVTLDMYTDIEISNNPSEVTPLIYGTDLFNCVFLHINNVQFDDMLRGIDAKIKHELEVGIAAISKGVNDLGNLLETMESQMSGMYDGINKEDLDKFASVLSGGDFDPTKILHSYMESRNKE